MLAPPSSGPVPVMLAQLSSGPVPVMLAPLSGPVPVMLAQLSSGPVPVMLAPLSSGPVPATLLASNGGSADHNPVPPPPPPTKHQHIWREGRGSTTTLVSQTASHPTQTDSPWRPETHIWVTGTLHIMQVYPSVQVRQHTGKTNWEWTEVRKGVLPSSPHNDQ